MTSPTPSSCLDLRGLPCPLNLIRSRLALEALAPGDWLQLDLDAGEPELSVAEGLRRAGHRVERLPPRQPEPPESAGSAGVRLLVRCHGA
ncbi:MAG: sulfurtransferase TusA family protein [Cyanobacteria bacterium J06638_7]